MWIRSCQRRRRYSNGGGVRSDTSHTKPSPDSIESKESSLEMSNMSESTSGLKSVLFAIRKRKCPSSSSSSSTFTPWLSSSSSSSSKTAMTTVAKFMRSLFWKDADIRRNICLLIVIGVVYHNSANGDFVHDDIPAIVENGDVVGTRHIRQLFLNDFWGTPMSDPKSHKSYRPITTLTFRWNMHLSNPTWPTLSFHVVNILLHYGVVILLGRICRQILEFDSKSTLMACLLYSVHPINVEAVASIVGRADLLCALFTLSALLAFNRALNQPQSNCGTMLGLTIVFSTLALGSKETGLTPLILCAMLLAHKCRASSFLLSSSFRKHLCALSSSFVILVGVRLWMLNGGLPSFAEQDNPAAFASSPLTRALTYVYLAAFNFALLLRPWNLSYDWQTGSIPLVESFADWRNGLSVALLLTLGLLVNKLVRCWGEQRRATRRDHNEILVILLSLGLIVVPYIPASNALVTVGFVVAERLLYIPSIGLVLLVVDGCRRIGFARNWHIWLACLAMIFASKCAQQSRTWSSRQSLYESGLRSVPGNAKAHYNYANLLQDTGNWSAAIEHYETAIRLWPEHASAHNNLGALHWRRSELDDAEVHFNAAIHINPTHSKAHFNLGKVLSKRGHLNEATKLLERSLTLESSFAEAYEALADVQFRLGRPLLAERLYQRAIQLWPRNADFHHNYATFLQRSGRSHSAVAHYFRAVHLRPGHRVALVNVASLCSTLQRYSSAEICYKRALKLNFDLTTLDQLGVLYLRQHRLPSARRVYEHIMHKTGILQSTRSLNSRPETLRQLPFGITSHYTQLLILEGRYEEAEQLLRTITSLPATPEVRKSSADLVGRASSISISNNSNNNDNSGQNSQQNRRVDTLGQSILSQSSNVGAAILADFQHQLGALYALTNRTDEALSSLGRALHWCEHGNMEQNSKIFSPESTRGYQEHEDDAKLCARFWIFSGDIRKDRGELELAHGSYLRAIMLDECSVHAHINLAGIHHLRREYTAALKHYAISYQLAESDEHHSLIRHNVANLMRHIDKQHSSSSSAHPTRTQSLNRNLGGSSTSSSTKSQASSSQSDIHPRNGGVSGGRSTSSISFVQQLQLCNDTSKPVAMSKATNPAGRDQTLESHDALKFNEYSLALSGLRCQFGASTSSISRFL